MPYSLAGAAAGAAVFAMVRFVGSIMKEKLMHHEPFL
jgi:hypothetical protein